jgi:hypothetical protein
MRLNFAMEQALDRIGRPTIAVRAVVGLTALVPAIHGEIRERIPAGLVGSLTGVSHEVDEALLQERLVSLLAAVFGALAVALACRQVASRRFTSGAE